jgi:hypothetical protein
MGTFLNMRRALALALVVLAVASTVFWPGGAAARSGQEAPTLIACLHHSQFKYLSRPSTCAFFARQYYPDGRLRRFRDIEGRDLKWTNWGRRVAVGVGKYQLPSFSLTIKAFHRVYCAHGRWYYAKVLIRGLPGGGNEGFHLRLARCGAKRFSPFNVGGSSGS